MSIIFLSIYLCCFQFFISVSQFSKNSSFTSLDRLIPRYFIIFDVMVNGTVSLISLSDSSFLVYRNATDFYILILDPTALPNSLMSSSNSFGGIFRVFCVQYHDICKQWQLYFFLSNLDSFYFFFLSDCYDQNFQYYVE